jgi:hypothetical protein
MEGESLYKIATLMGNSPEICRKDHRHVTYSTFSIAPLPPLPP